MIEIERKFLVEGTGWQQHAEPGFLILQGYIAVSDHNAVRVRILGDGSAWLAIKSAGSKMTRNEYEYPIPIAHARRLLDTSIGDVIEKTRHLAAHEGYVWEIDVYHGHLDGLVVCEVELADESDDPDRPEWCGRELTGNPVWSNRALAIDGMPEEFV